MAHIGEMYQSQMQEGTHKFQPFEKQKVNMRPQEHTIIFNGSLFIISNSFFFF